MARRSDEHALEPVTSVITSRRGIELFGRINAEQFLATGRKRAARAEGQ